MIGRALAHYKILEKLGSGGMGDVYLAEDTKLSRQVALKVLPPDAATDTRLERFEREAKAIAALDHPNIVHVYSVEEADGVHFITMQLVHGKTLTELVPKDGSIGTVVPRRNTSLFHSRRWEHEVPGGARRCVRKRATVDRFRTTTRKPG